MEARKPEGETAIAKTLAANKTESKLPSLLKGEKPLKVFTDHELLRKSINDNRFQVVSHVEDAEVVHATQNMKYYQETFGEQ